MLLCSLVAFAAFALPKAAKAFTVLPIGDGLTAGYNGKEGQFCSYRYALEKLAADRGSPLTVLGSVRDSPEVESACAGQFGLSKGDGASEGHWAAIGADMYQKIENWISAPSYKIGSTGRLAERVDAVIMTMGERDCLNQESQDPDVNPYKRTAQGVKWALWSLGGRLAEDTPIFFLPIMMPATASSDARECAKWVNEKLSRPGYLSSNVHMVNLPQADALPSEKFVTVDNLYFPTSEFSQELAAAIINHPLFKLPSGADKASELPASVRMERSRMEDGEGEGDGAGAGVTETADGEDGAEDEYGYAWCLDNYDQNECFDYYYGYDWCTENYDKEECFDYYYGYDWCVKYYDQQECHDYYNTEEEGGDDAAEVTPAAAETSSTTETAENQPAEGAGEASGSGDEYGYDWCLENYDQDDCFDYYYGYKWCLDYYDDDECYDYYYPPDFDWNEQSNYKWCLNFYLPNDCEVRYYPNAGDVKLPVEDEADSWFSQHKGTGIFGGLFGVASLCGLGYWCYQRQNGASYSPFDDGEGDELL